MEGSQFSASLISGVYGTLALSGVGSWPAARPAAVERPEDLPTEGRVHDTPTAMPKDV